MTRHASKAELPDVELPDEAVEKSVSGGLRRGSRSSGLAGHPKSLDEADQYPRGTCGLNASCQLTCHLRARECASGLGLHSVEKIADATFNIRVVTSQFHGCSHQQASAPTTGAARAVDVTSKQGPQAINRPVVRTEFDVYPRQSVGDIAIERAQEERVLAPEGGIKAATRKLRRAKKVRQRRGVIAARPEHTHRALDRGFRVETTGPATRHPRWGLACHKPYI
jgi:hypothetical protein